MKTKLNYHDEFKRLNKEIGDDEQFKSKSIINHSWADTLNKFIEKGISPTKKEILEAFNLGVKSAQNNEGIYQGYYLSIEYAVDDVIDKRKKGKK